MFEMYTNAGINPSLQQIPQQYPKEALYEN